MFDKPSHAPRERVSWNFNTFNCFRFSQMSRSTWACELKCSERCHWTQGKSSRSTWACELKSVDVVRWVSSARHAPRERVSWNRREFYISCVLSSVTLHVSVWVEMQTLVVLAEIFACHAPRERVSWNYNVLFFIWNWYRHAPRERVSWNFSVSVENGLRNPSRSTWACELKWQKCEVEHQQEIVTLHVSVWVEMACCLFCGNGWLSRSTWACELKCFASALLSTAATCHAPRERVSWNATGRHIR